jgi:transposase
LATIYDDGARSEAARVGNVGLQIIRDWVLRFNAEGPDGLIDRKAPVPAPRLADVHRKALAAIIESGPIPAVHGVVRWRLVDLCQWPWEELRVSIAQANSGSRTARPGLSERQFRAQALPLPFTALACTMSRCS